MSLPRPLFRYHEYVGFGKFLQFAKSLNPGQDMSKTLEVFPSHAKQHTESTTLYLQKKGGMVNVAGKHLITAEKAHANLKKKDLKTATLGLPIHGLPILNEGDE